MGNTGNLDVRTNAVNLARARGKYYNGIPKAIKILYLARNDIDRGNAQERLSALNKGLINVRRGKVLDYNTLMRIGFDDYSAECLLKYDIPLEILAALYQRELTEYDQRAQSEKSPTQNL